MIPDAVKELNAKLKAVQQAVYEGEFEAVPNAFRSTTREVESRLVGYFPDEHGEMKPKWALTGSMPFPAATSYKHVTGWPSLLDDHVKTFSGEIRAVHLPPGTKIRRVIGSKGRNTGPCWLYELPKDGPSWRKDFAVLSRWSANGEYIELVVPEGGLRVWEGTVASQFDEQSGQVLFGGDVQLVVYFDFAEHAEAKAIAEKLARRRTNWTGHELINIPEEEVGVQTLSASELAPKWDAPTAANAASHATRSQNGDSAQDATP
jgi:hypothetical protein